MRLLRYAAAIAHCGVLASANPLVDKATTGRDTGGTTPQTQSQHKPDDRVIPGVFHEDQLDSTVDRDLPKTPPADLPVFESAPIRNGVRVPGTFTVVEERNPNHGQSTPWDDLIVVYSKYKVPIPDGLRKHASEDKKSRLKKSELSFILCVDTPT